MPIGQSKKSVIRVIRRPRIFCGRKVKTFYYPIDSFLLLTIDRNRGYHLTMSRTPPKTVREELRKEVNFGCPVPDCGSPYLIYHHFDPPWKDKQRHDPKGMIALCRNHHHESDAGAWTNEQLRAFKSNPYIEESHIEGKFSWLRRDILLDAGPIIHQPHRSIERTILQLGKERAIWMKRDNKGFQRLSMRIRDSRSIERGNLRAGFLYGGGFHFTEKGHIILTR